MPNHKAHMSLRSSQRALSSLPRPRRTSPFKCPEDAQSLFSRGWSALFTFITHLAPVGFPASDSLLALDKFQRRLWDGNFRVVARTWHKIRWLTVQRPQQNCHLLAHISTFALMLIGSVPKYTWIPGSWPGMVGLKTRRELEAVVIKVN